MIWFTQRAVNAEAPLLTLLYVLTWCFAVAFPMVLQRRMDEHWWRDAALAGLALAAVGTLAGTCVLAGLNRVYTLPHLVVFTICAAYAWENRRRIAGWLRRASTRA